MKKAKVGSRAGREQAESEAEGGSRAGREQAESEAEGGSRAGLEQAEREAEGGSRAGREQAEREARGKCRFILIAQEECLGFILIAHQEYFPHVCMWHPACIHSCHQSTDTVQQGTCAALLWRGTHCLS